MSSTLVRFVQALTPPPFVNPRDYDGTEWKWRFLVFRPALLAKEFYYERYYVLILLMYFAYFLYGKYCNLRVANTWFEAHLPLLTRQFSRPTNNGLTSDGASDFFNFSTGRRNIATLHSNLTLRPRHDILQYLFQQIWALAYDLQYRPIDELELDFTLSEDAGVADFVFAIAKKEELGNLKKDRWDLSLTTHKDNPAFGLPSSLIIMSESADVTENILKLPFIQALIESSNLPYFRSLSVTDQPRERPTSLADHPHAKRVLLSLAVPPPHCAADTLNIIEATFSFIDALGKVNLRPDTKAKLRKAREEIDRLLTEESGQDKKKEADEAKREKKRNAEAERRSRLSAVEQRKAAERDRKRANKKMMGKVGRK